MRTNKKASTTTEPLALYLPSVGSSGKFGFGGTERVAVTLAREFVEAGLAVDLLLNVTHPGSSAEVDQRVRIVDLKCRQRPWVAVFKLIAYRWRRRPSVVLSFMPGCNSLNVVSSWLGPRTSKAVISERSTRTIALESRKTVEGPILLHGLCRVTYPWASAIIGCSEGVAKNVRNAYPKMSEKVVGIPNPVEPSVHNATTVSHPWLGDPRIPCIIAIGRLHAVKDPLTLLLTVARIRQRREVRLLVFGDGPLRLQIEAEIKRLELQDAVQLLGQRSDVRSYLSQADLFLHTARWEGFGVVIAEALAEGVPVVSTDCAGPTEILDSGRFGRLVPIGDVDALAAAALQALDETRNPDRLRQRAATFAPDTIANEYLNVLYRAISGAEIHSGPLT